MMPLVYHPAYSPEFSSDHRFPMEKFARLFEYLLSINLIEQCQLHTPLPGPDEIISLAHCPLYVSDYRNNRLSSKAMRRIGLPWSEGVRDRTFLAVGGSLMSTDLAIKHGISAHLAGGTHHAHFNEGSGFCIFNDLAVCALYALTKPGINSVMIIDVDVHQGDGTARLLADHNNITSVSVHCKQNFPARKAKSDYDLEVEHGTGDETYLALIKQQIPYLLDIHCPDLVLYDAGADVHKEDVLGLLTLTDNGLFQRDHFILNQCAERGIPVSCVIGGGYMKDRQRLAEVHGIVHRAALEVYQEHYQ